MWVSPVLPCERTQHVQVRVLERGGRIQHPCQQGQRIDGRRPQLQARQLQCKGGLAYQQALEQRHCFSQLSGRVADIIQLMPCLRSYARVRMLLGVKATY